MTTQIAESSATDSVSGRRTSFSLNHKPEAKVNSTSLGDSVKEFRNETISPANALNSDPHNSKNKNDTDLIGIKKDNHVLLSTKKDKDRHDDCGLQEENTQANGHKSQKQITSDNRMYTITNDMEVQKGKTDSSKNSRNLENTQIEANTECNDESNQNEGKSKKDNTNIKDLETNENGVVHNNVAYIDVCTNEISVEDLSIDVTNPITTAKEKRESEGARTDNDKNSEDPMINVEKEGNGGPVNDNCKSATSLVIINQSSVSTNDCAKLSNTSDDEDMECLLLHSEVEIPRPSTHGKILKLKTFSKASTCKTAEITLNRTGGTSPVISSPESVLDSNTSTPITDQHFVSALRTTIISGRRSLRPLSELSFRNSYREHYRKINTELDADTSSMNVTVGSEVPNDSTSSFLGGGKKRERIDVSETQIRIGPSAKSTKRPRLDISSLLNVVKTPISILRSRFSNTRIRSSVPYIQPIQKEVEYGVENVSVIESEEAIDQKAEVNEDAAKISLKIVKNDEQLKYVEMGTKTDQNLTTLEDLQQIEVVKNIDQKSSCNIM